MNQTKARLTRLRLLILHRIIIAWHSLTRTPRPTVVIPCWNCRGMMRQYAEDSFYWFYECPRCGKLKAESKNE